MSPKACQGLGGCTNQRWPLPSTTRVQHEVAPTHDLILTMGSQNTGCYTSAAPNFTAAFALSQGVSRVAEAACADMKHDPWKLPAAGGEERFHLAAHVTDCFTEAYDERRVHCIQRGSSGVAPRRDHGRRQLQHRQMDGLFPRFCSGSQRATVSAFRRVVAVASSCSNASTDSCVYDDGACGP